MTPWIRLSSLKVLAIFITILCLLGGGYYWHKKNVQIIAPAPSIVQEIWKSFDFGGQRYPIIYEKEYIAVGGEIRKLDFFLPVFSPNRPVVNPKMPRVVIEGGRSLLYFDSPGEYYVEAENNIKLKVLVLNQREHISENVLRLFDFLVANLVVTQGNDKEFYENSGNFTIDFFMSKDPKMLLCGPTLSFFEILLRDRFNLPVRDVTFTGVFMEGGQLKYSTHNVIEVFLPDLNKWVMFDVNNGFVAKWLDSFEITEKIRSASATKTNISKLEFDSIVFDAHYLVDAKRSLNAADLRGVFSPDIISRESVRDRWYDLAKIFLGGPGYWGGRRFNQNGLSSDFQLYESQYHQDPFLLDAQLRWVGNWDLKVRHVPPEELKTMLNKAYSDQIAAKKWASYLPSQSSTAGIQK
jgi:hypothetical protein